MQSLILGSPEFYSPLALFLGSFCFGVLLAPWGLGVFFLFLFLILWEILFYGYCIARRLHWCPPVRLGALLTYIFGWIVGRTVVGLSPMERGLPDFLENWFRPQ